MKDIRDFIATVSSYRIIQGKSFFFSESGSTDNSRHQTPKIDTRDRATRESDSRSS